jgi:hypothetical protein
VSNLIEAERLRKEEAAHLAKIREQSLQPVRSSMHRPANMFFAEPLPRPQHSFVPPLPRTRRTASVTPDQNFLNENSVRPDDRKIYLVVDTCVLLKQADVLKDLIDAWPRVMTIVVINDVWNELEKKKHDFKAKYPNAATRAFDYLKDAKSTGSYVHVYGDRQATVLTDFDKVHFNGI